MPTYDYQCQKCGFEFERQQRITEDPIKTCPECKSRQAKRLLSAPSFILKGGGWYADGYGSTGNKKSDSDSASASSESSSSSDGGGKTGGDDSSGSAGKSPKKGKASKASSGSGGGSGGGAKARKSAA